MKTNEHVGKENGNFPNRLIYPSRCGALCKTAATQEVWRAHQRLQQLLAQFCKELGKPAGIPFLDVVLRGETIGANGEHIHVSHVYLASCGGQAGLIQARENLLELNVVAQHEHDGENCTLRLSREDFIEPRHQTLRSPFNELPEFRVGPLKSCSGDEWLASLVVPEGMDRVHIVKMAARWQLESDLDTLVVQGCDQAFNAIDASIVQAKEDLADVVPEGSDSNSDVDYLGGLGFVAPAAPSPRKR